MDGPCEHRAKECFGYPQCSWRKVQLLDWLLMRLVLWCAARPSTRSQLWKRWSRKLKINCRPLQPNVTFWMRCQLQWIVASTSENENVDECNCMCSWMFTDNLSKTWFHNCLVVEFQDVNTCCQGRVHSLPFKIPNPSYRNLFTRKTSKKPMYIYIEKKKLYNWRYCEGSSVHPSFVRFLLTNEFFAFVDGSSTSLTKLRF